ncbi:unnamed protein product [Dicrocoelium dendriticum]|nr:unnamed protein product [Dicrocoelium dendriticum]
MCCPTLPSYVEDNAAAWRPVKLFYNLWLFHISKLVECLDTVFFILSGKSRLVTWLHVYHHSSIIPYSRYMAEYVPDGHVFNFAALNSAIHVIMYGYYAVAALGPAWRRFLWWKRYLTLLQMAQFIYGITIALASAQLGCAYRPSTYYISAAYISSILACFMNHYYQTYRAGKAKRRSDKLETSKTD